MSFVKFTLADIRAAVKDKLDDTGFSNDSIDRAANDFQFELFNDNRIRFMEKHTVLSWGISENHVDIPLPQLYSNWKDNITLSDNFTYDFAYEVIGGQDTFGTQEISKFFFQQNGWKLRPKEISHTATLTNGVIIAESGGPVNSVLGTYTVMVDYQKPEHVITLTTDDPVTPADVADAVWDEAISGHLTAGTTGKKLNDASKAKLLL